MTEPTTKERETARVNTFRSIVSDAINEFSADGGDPTIIIDELVDCLSALICKITPGSRKPVRPLLQIGTLCALKNAFIKDADK